MSNAESSYQTTGIVSSVLFAEVEKVLRIWAIDNKFVQYLVTKYDFVLYFSEFSHHHFQKRKTLQIF